MSTPLRENRRYSHSPLLSPGRSRLVKNRYCVSDISSPGSKILHNYAPGPLLATTNYNTSLSTYIDSKSPGLSSRIVQYSGDTVEKIEPFISHQAKYGSPGIFPIVHLQKKSLPIRKLPRDSVTIRLIATPDSPTYNLNSSGLSNDSQGSDTSTSNVLKALRAISKKRALSEDITHSQNNHKRQRNDCHIEVPEIEINLNIATKINAEDSVTKSVDDIPCVVDAFAASLTSSNASLLRIRNTLKHKINRTFIETSATQSPKQRLIEVETQTDNLKINNVTQTTEEQPKAQEASTAQAASSTNNVHVDSHTKVHESVLKDKLLSGSITLIRELSSPTPQDKHKAGKQVTFNLPTDNSESVVKPVPVIAPISASVPKNEVTLTAPTSLTLSTSSDKVPATSPNIADVISPLSPSVTALPFEIKHSPATLISGGIPFNTLKPDSVTTGNLTSGTIQFITSTPELIITTTSITSTSNVSKLVTTSVFTTPDNSVISTSFGLPKLPSMPLFTQSPSATSLQPASTLVPNTVYNQDKAITSSALTKVSLAPQLKFNNNNQFMTSTSLPFGSTPITLSLLNDNVTSASNLVPTTLLPTAALTGSVPNTATLFRSTPTIAVVPFSSATTTTNISFGSVAPTALVPFGSVTNTAPIQFGSTITTSVPFGSITNTAPIQFGSTTTTTSIPFGSVTNTAPLAFGSVTTTASAPFDALRSIARIPFNTVSTTASVPFGTTPLSEQKAFINDKFEPIFTTAGFVFHSEPQSLNGNHAVPLGFDNKPGGFKFEFSGASSGALGINNSTTAASKFEPSFAVSNSNQSRNLNFGSNTKVTSTFGATSIFSTGLETKPSTNVVDFQPSKNSVSGTESKSIFSSAIATSQPQQISTSTNMFEFGAKSDPTVSVFNTSTQATTNSNTFKFGSATTATTPPMFPAPMMVNSIQTLRDSNAFKFGASVKTAPPVFNAPTHNTNELNLFKFTPPGTLKDNQLSNKSASFAFVPATTTPSFASAFNSVQPASELNNFKFDALPPNTTAPDFSKPAFNTSGQTHNEQSIFKFGAAPATTTAGTMFNAPMPAFNFTAPISKTPPLSFPTTTSLGTFGSFEAKPANPFNVSGFGDPKTTGPFRVNQTFDTETKPASIFGNTTQNQNVFGAFSTTTNNNNDQSPFGTVAPPLQTGPSQPFQFGALTNNPQANVFTFGASNEPAKPANVNMANGVFSFGTNTVNNSFGTTATPTFAAPATAPSTFNMQAASAPNFGLSIQGTPMFSIGSGSSTHKPRTQLKARRRT